MDQPYLYPTPAADPSAASSEDGARSTLVHRLPLAALAAMLVVSAVSLASPKTFALARSLGATHAINVTKADAAEEIKKIVGNDGVDVAVDNTGNVEVIALASRLTNARGRTVLVGVPPKDSTAAISTLPLHFEKQLVGSHGGECRPDVDIPHYVRMVREGRLSLAPLIGHRYPLADINDAIADMKSGRLAGRAIVHVSRSS